MSNETIEQALARLKASLAPSFDIGGLFSRNKFAHKWQATFRSVLLREAVFWRLEDLLQQSYALHKMKHSLGALILLRSALETLATLIYLNQLTASVLEGSLDFHTYSDKTAVLLLGSRNKMTDREAINIQTVLKKCVKRYDFIEKFYGDLSECAHPNHEASTLIGTDPVPLKIPDPLSARVFTRRSAVSVLWFGGSSICVDGKPQCGLTAARRGEKLRDGAGAPVVGRWLASDGEIVCGEETAYASTCGQRWRLQCAVVLRLPPPTAGGRRCRRRALRARSERRIAGVGVGCSTGVLVEG